MHLIYERLDLLFSLAHFVFRNRVLLSREYGTWLIVKGIQYMAYSQGNVVHGVFLREYGTWLIIEGIRYSLNDKIMSVLSQLASSSSERALDGHRRS